MTTVSIAATNFMIKIGLLNLWRCFDLRLLFGLPFFEVALNCGVQTETGRDLAPRVQ